MIHQQAMVDNLSTSVDSISTNDVERNEMRGLCQTSKILQFLLENEDKKEVSFKDVVIHLDRDKGQVSTILKSLRVKGFIQWDEGRNKTISITQQGKEVFTREIIDPLKMVFTLINERSPNSVTKKSSPRTAGHDGKLKIDKTRLYARLIPHTVKNLKEDLSQVSEYIDADTFSGMVDDMKETIENSLNKFFGKITFYHDPDHQGLIKQP